MINVINANKQRIITIHETYSIIKRVLRKEKKVAKFINLIFVNDITIKKLNRKYLNHNSITDVICFPLDSEEVVDGEIYICTDQAKRQAIYYNTRYIDEVKRLIIHGVLHLIGYSDKSNTQKSLMRKLEDLYLKKK